MAQFDESILWINSIFIDEQFREKHKELQGRVNKLLLTVEKVQYRLDRTREIVGNAMNFRIHAREQFLMRDLDKRRERLPAPSECVMSLMRARSTSR